MRRGVPTASAVEANTAAIEPAPAKTVTKADAVAVEPKRHATATWNSNTAECFIHVATVALAMDLHNALIDIHDLAHDSFDR
jgi:hypothetical protein